MFKWHSSLICLLLCLNTSLRSRRFGVGCFSEGNSREAKLRSNNTSLILYEKHTKLPAMQAICTLSVEERSDDIAEPVVVQLFVVMTVL